MKYAKLETEENQGTAFLMQKAVEIFCNLDLKNIVKLKYKSLADVVQHIDSLFNKKHKFIDRFVMNGVEYGFIPLLDDISMGEYIDLDSYFGDWEQMHKAMAVLFRPITHNKNERYDIEEYKGTDNSESYKDMPVDVVLGSLVFFYNLSSELLTVTLSCLEKDETNWIHQQHSEGSGVGIKAYMHSLKEMLQSMQISLN
jgi:hypothetical protein